MPLPFFAKANGFHQGYIGVVHWNAMAAMVTFVLVALPFLLVIVSTVSRRTYLQLLAIGVIVAATFSYYITVTQIMGRNARYYYPSLSFVVLAAFVAAFAQADEPRIRITYSNILPRIALGFLIVMAALPGPVRTFSIKMWGEHVIGTPVFVKAKTQYRMAASNPLPQLGWWIGIERMVDVLTCLPQGSIFAASEYGIIASGFPDLVIIDLVGLHDKVIAHRGFSADYVISRKPDLIWFPHGDYTYEVADILDNSSFQKDYEYYPGAYNFGIAIRKDSERYSEIKKVISREFRRIYPWYNLSDYVAVPM
ncbi:MAG: hypothetical protein E4G89_06130 [Methanothrix sp.]|nr:MAG: hypothetical protein E4G89_06130 [Methanothrix sp.]